MNLIIRDKEIIVDSDIYEDIKDKKIQFSTLGNRPYAYYIENKRKRMPQ